MFGFVKGLLGVKAEQVGHSVVKALVEFDPEAATEAQLREMEKHLDALGIQLAKARASYDKEQREADEIQKLYGQRLAAAEKLEERRVAASESDRPDIEASLNRLVAMLEEMQPQIETEVAEAQDAKGFLDDLTRAYEGAAGKFKTARATLEKAARDMERAKLQEQTARERAERAKQAAGIGGTVDTLNIALQAMTEKAAESRAVAQGADLKARLLTKTDVEKDDRNIAAAMAEVQGTARPALGVSERLAALKQLPKP